jgi:hypothetical protein
MLASAKLIPPVVHLERKSGGNFSKRGNNGISKSDALSVCTGLGGGGAEAGEGCTGAAAGVAAIGGGTALVTWRAGSGGVSSLLSTRRSIPLSKPANFVLKLLANALMILDYL